MSILCYGAAEAGPALQILQIFVHFHFMPYNLGCGLIRHAGLEAQVNMVCHKTKLVSILLIEEPSVGNLDQTEKSVSP